MTTKEAIRLLTTMRNTCEHNLHLEALNLAIAALTDPEWIPNTGTKPECEFVYYRCKDDDRTFTHSSNMLDWKKGGITHYIPIPDPPKFKEERRYVVHEDNAHGPYRVCDIGARVTFYYVANYIPTREAAQQIADIYEGVKQ